MRIEIDTATSQPGELTAIIALCLSLGASLPEFIGQPVTVVNNSRPAPPPPADDLPASERLLAEAAATRAAPPPPPEDEGQAADPTTLDKEGIPWDARIHASTKTQNKDGTWKKLRNVDEVLYGEVHAELQAANAGNDRPAPPPPADAGASAPTADQSQGQTGAGNATGATDAPPPPPTDGARFNDFPSFVQAVNAIKQPPIPYLELNAIAATLGVAGGFKDMKDQAPLWEAFYGMAGGQ